ncbi:MAG: hypothetical protein EOO51_08105 [Flavobacterium sp.]|nr:MAG: hypothetical protein EOO51_08105 [Flavobacterium sp.]
MRPALRHIYKSLDGQSAICCYECGSDYIKVQFKETGMIYKFSHRTAGRKHVSAMKKLAATGHGLGNYIELFIVMK